MRYLSVSGIRRLAAPLLLAGLSAQGAPFAYVANSASGSVTVIDTPTNTVVATVGVGSSPRAVAVNPSGTRAYITAFHSIVSVIETATNTVIATIPLPSDSGNIALNPAGTKMYVSVFGALVVIDTATHATTATIPFDGYPGNFAINPDGTRLYAINKFDAHSMSVIDTATHAVTATVPVGMYPQGVAINPSGTRVYVTNSGTNTLSVMDTTSNTVVATVGLGFSPGGLAINPTGTRLYVLNRDSGNVWVIDTATHAATAVVDEVGVAARIAIDPAGTKAYVTSYNSLKVIDTATNTVTATVGVGTSPEGVAIGPRAPTFLPRLANISTRGQVLTGSDVMIAGFIIGGPSAKTIVAMVSGPSLTAAGVPGALQNPTLSIVRASDGATIATNDNWQTQNNPADAAALQDAGFAPQHPLEPAVMMTLPPGAYTAVVQGIGGTGVGLVALYEVDHPEVPLINISTRGQVLTGADVMIAGFIVQGGGPQTVVATVAGPSLANAGVPGPLANPTLTIVRASDGAIIASNDDWQSGPNAPQIQANGFAPSHPLEPAIMMTLAPGAYTAVVQGAGGGTGVGLVGVYTALLAPQGGPFAYIAKGGSANSVSVIDTTTNTVTTSIGVGYVPAAVAVSPSGRRAYVVNEGSDSVSVIDIPANTVTATVQLTSGPLPPPTSNVTPLSSVAINPAGTRLYVAGFYSGRVRVIDTATNRVIASVDIPGSPQGIAVNPAGTRVYVTNTHSQLVSVIDTATNTITASVPVGLQPYGVVVNAAGTRAYVANRNSNSVSVINTTFNGEWARVPVGAGPTGVAIDPAGTRVYVANSGSNTVSVIDAATNTVTATVGVGSAPYDVAISSDGSRVYVVNTASHNVSVINTASNTVIATIAVDTPRSKGPFVGPPPVPRY